MVSHNGSKTHCKHGHEFTAANTSINTWGGRVQRVCLACNRARQARYRRGEATPKAATAAAGDKVWAWTAIKWVGPSVYGPVFLWRCECGRERLSAVAQIRRSRRCLDCSRGLRRVNETNLQGAQW